VTDAPVRVAFYGTGRFACSTHIPNLLRIPGVEIAALCDSSPAALEQAAALAPGAARYADAEALLAAAGFDALYSCVPAFARTDVEARAAQRGMHLFSEKPQALRLEVALAIDAAVQASGVIATVGFRERYRPLVLRARELFAGRRLTHAAFLQHARPPAARHTWYRDVALSGGPALNWGGHALDQIRFITGEEVAGAQAFWGSGDLSGFPPSQSLSFVMESGATATLTFVTSGAITDRYHRNAFSFFHRDGVLEVDDYDCIRADGETVCRGEETDPWLEQDRAFVEAVRRRDPSLLRSDYHDGIRSLAPILAAWESARRGGAVVDVGAYGRERAARVAAPPIRR
jgi:predicted dehydrogenase